MGKDVGQIFPTASIHRNHSILYGLVCEKKLSSRFCVREYTVLHNKTKTKNNLANKNNRTTEFERTTAEATRAGWGGGGAIMICIYQTFALEMI